MNVALAGLTAREVVALGMLVGTSLPSWQCSATAPDRHAPLPPADLYVIDLAGLGMARWSEAAQSELFKALNGTPAVLVAPAFDETWEALDGQRRKIQPLVLLHKPYGIESMNSALRQAAAGCAAPARSTSRPAPPPVGPAPGLRDPPALLSVLPPQAVGSGVMVPRVIAAKPPVPARVAQGGELAVDDFQARAGTLPDTPFFIRSLAKALAGQQPFEVRVSFINRMIFHPGEQWVASNTPPQVLAHLCEDDALASAIEIDTIDGNDALARAQRLGMPAQPLKGLLWTLAQGHLCEKV